VLQPEQAFLQALQVKDYSGADKSYAISNTSAAIQGLHNFTISLWAKIHKTKRFRINEHSKNLTFWEIFDVFF